MKTTAVGRSRRTPAIRFAGLLSALLGVMLLTGVAGAAPIVFEGNAYDLVDDGVWSWEQARDFAETQTFHGVSGHLVVITSGAENEFIRTAFNTDDEPFGGPWIGMFLTPGAPGNQFSSYEWVTGEAATFDGFLAGEPSGDPTSAGVLNGVGYLDLHDKGWNDFHWGARQGSLIVEFENVPEPGSVALLGLGLGIVGLAIRRRRRIS